MLGAQSLTGDSCSPRPRQGEPPGCSGNASDLRLTLPAYQETKRSSRLALCSLTNV